MDSHTDPDLHCPHIQSNPVSLDALLMKHDESREKGPSDIYGTSAQSALIVKLDADRSLVTKQRTIFL